jgi:hypothetical protein
MTEPIQPPQRRSGSPGAAVLGGILIVLGLLFFAGQQLNFNLADATWPFYVIAPGVALLALGLTQSRGVGLTIAGSIVTIVGLILLYQNATDHWESWAYAWALVGPGGSGMGMLLYGTRSGNAKMARAGFWQVLTALALFSVGLFFFEGVLGISGRRLPLPEWVLPVSIMVIGLVVLLRGFTAGRGPRGEFASEQKFREGEAAPQPEPPPTEGGDSPPAA